jgi:hypothetical protein
MKYVLGTIIAVGLIMAGPVPSSAQPVTSPPITRGERFFNFYAANLRGSLFSGFLTLGSFLVAVNTFLIVNLKKEVYDHPAYKKIVYKNRDETKTASFYGPLSRLSRLLYSTIILALSTSAAQLTIGVLIQHWLAAAACLLLAAFTMAMLFFALAQIRGNLSDWFEYLEDQAVKEYDEQRSDVQQLTPPAP